MYAAKSHFMLFTVLACSLSVSSALADGKTEAKKAKLGGWSGNFSLGLNTSQGNTNTGRANIGFLAKHGVKKAGTLQHTFLGAYDYGDRGTGRGSDRIETKNDKEFSYKLDYNVTNRGSVVAYAGYEDNKKAKLESQEMIGLGYELAGFGTKHHKFSGGLGLGHLAVEYTDGTEGFSGEALRASVGYKGQITKHLSVSTGVVYLAAEERKMTRSLTKVDYKLSNRASLVLKYKSTYFDYIPATAIDKKDDTTNLNVVFRF